MSAAVESAARKVQNNLTNLARALTAYQQKFDVEAKTLADQIGICESSLCRIKKGAMPDARGLARIVAWLVETEK